MRDIAENLRSVTCNPDGVVCIDGSDADRAIIQQVIADIDALVEAARYISHATQRQPATLQGVTYYPVPNYEIAALAALLPELKERMI